MLDFNVTSTTASRHDDTRQVCDALNCRIVDLALALGLERDAWSTAMDRRFGRNGHVSVKPAKGVWHDYRDGVGGDGLALVSHALGYPPKDRAGKRAAFAWARQWLGMDGKRPPQAPRPATREAAEQAAFDRLLGEEMKRAQSRFRAQLLFDRAFPCLQSNPCEAYLRRRGIWTAAQRTPLRWTKLDHPYTQERDLDVLGVPLVEGTGTPTVVGVQRIYLNADGSKYSRAKAKLSLGGPGVAMLHAPGRRLVLAEGLESALSASLIYDRFAWCFCGGFPPEVILPAVVQDVLLAVDHDLPFDRNNKPKVTSLMKGSRLARFILATGRTCVIEMPEAPGADANDILLAREAA